MKDKYREEYRKLGIRIAYLRNQRGKTQQEIADMIGIDQQHMSKIERGKIGVPFDRLLDIAGALRVPPSKLLEFEDVVSIG